MGKLTDEEFRDFLKTCRELAEGPLEVTNKFPQEFIDLARENNLYRYALPEQYGGWGFTEKEILQVQEEFSRGPGGMRMHLHYAADLNWRILDDYGCDELKAAYMDKFADKTIFTCFALTEQTGGTGADVHTTAVKDALLTELSVIDRAPLPRAENIAMPRREPVRKVEHFDTTQAKLCMLFTLGRPMQPEQLAAVRLAMALCGGSVTSRLFLNVRERDHLCYYCSSSFQSFTGSMAVNSGVEHADAARAEQAVLKELADLCDGPITDEELEDCRRGLLAGMNGLEDTLGGIETWYYMEVLRGGPVQTPDDARRALLAVTRENVRDILKQFTLSVSCLLTREEGNENG